MNPEELANQVAQHAVDFLLLHSTDKKASSKSISLLDGEFGLYRGQSNPDLYGMIDAVYILYMINELAARTDRISRARWAERILECQDEYGWFSKLNLRGHSPEHATAYAIGALKLLEVEDKEHYVHRIRPLNCLLPILTDQREFVHWIENLGFRFTFDDIAGHLGWHYIWRGSHIGGGVAATIGMTRDLFHEWWSGSVNTDQWFKSYFEWLDTHVNPETGYWQRALWNLVYRKPTTIDMGGAVHFLWVYSACHHPFPFPGRIIDSTVSLQKESGLYRDYPFCIDFDGNFCIVRSYLQLPESKRQRDRSRVHQAIEANFETIVTVLNSRPLEDMYHDSHGLPGALAALIECTKLPGFKYTKCLESWQHPLDRVCWL